MPLKNIYSEMRQVLLNGADTASRLESGSAPKHSETLSKQRTALGQGCRPTL
jgi:hypothetical protein